jgi:hypothetical protein
MDTTTARDPIAPCVLQPSSMPGTIATDISCCALPAMSCGPVAEADTTLLAAALEEIEARRVAIEWLLDADLLCLCLA